jgi:hypothetical protein
VALDDDAVEAEEDAAVDLSRIHLVAQRANGVSREHIADAGHQGAAHGVAHIGRDLPRRSFGRLQRDISGEAFRDHHIDGAEADIIPFDEADVIEIGEIGLAQHAPCLADRLQALDFLDTHVEETDKGLVDVEHHARHGGAHHGKIGQMLGVGTDIRADIEHDALATRIGPDDRERRAIDTGHGAKAKGRHGHERAGVPGRDGDIGLFFLHRLDGEPHRRFPPAGPQGLTRFVVHLHGDIGVVEGGEIPDARIAVEKRHHLALAPVEHIADVGAPLARDRGAGHQRFRTMVAPHQVERDADGLGHGFRDWPSLRAWHRLRGAARQ